MHAADQYAGCALLKLSSHEILNSERACHNNGILMTRGTTRPSGVHDGIDALPTAVYADKRLEQPDMKPRIDLSATSASLGEGSEIKSLGSALLTSFEIGAGKWSTCIYIVQVFASCIA